MGPDDSAAYATMLRELNAHKEVCGASYPYPCTPTPVPLLLPLLPTPKHYPLQELMSTHDGRIAAEQKQLVTRVRVRARVGVWVSVRGKS